MADLSVTASAVVPTTNAVIAQGTAGATITQGQAVYADPSDSYKIKPAAHTSATTASVVGIALNGASAGQPVSYAVSGDVTFNSIFTAATVYTLGGAAGAIAPSADLDASSNTRYGTVVGIATSGTNLRLGIVASDVRNP